IVDSDGCIIAASRSFRVSRSSLYRAQRSLSRRRARLIWLFSSSVVSWYKYLIKSVWVNVFIIGSVFRHFLAQIDQRISHPAQSRINTDACAVGDFLKSHIKLVPHNEHVLLFFWQLPDIIPKSGPGLFKHLFFLGGFLCEIQGVEQLAAIFKNYLGVTLLFSEVVDRKFVRNATNPREKLSL